MATISIGVDIDPRQDSTAIAVVERLERQGTDRKSEMHHEARHLERLPVGRSYPEVAKRLAEIVAGLPRPTGRWSHLYSPRLYVNATRVGRPVADLLDARVKAHVVRVFVTDGHERTEEEKGDEVRVGRRWLASRLQVLLQDQRLYLPQTPESEELKQELLQYEDGDEASGSLVTALGLAVQEDYVGGYLGKPIVVGGHDRKPSELELRAGRLIRESLDHELPEGIKWWRDGL